MTLVGTFAVGINVVIITRVGTSPIIARMPVLELTVELRDGAQRTTQFSLN